MFVKLGYFFIRTFRKVALVLLSFIFNEFVFALIAAFFAPITSKCFCRRKFNITSIYFNTIIVREPTDIICREVVLIQNPCNLLFDIGITNANAVQILIIWVLPYFFFLAHSSFLFSIKHVTTSGLVPSMYRCTTRHGTHSSL